MRLPSYSLIFAAGLSLSATPLLAQMPAPTPPAAANAAPAASADPIERIKEEGLKHSQVMTTLSYLTDVIGPRLTGSPNLKRANEWARDQLSKYGLQNAHLESWGPFGRGWTLQSFTAEVTAPQPITLIAYPKAWSPGVELTNAEVVYIDAKTPADLEKYRGQLRGKVVLNGAAVPVAAHFDAQGSRKTDKDLRELADAPVPAASVQSDQTSRLRQAQRRAALAGARNQFFLREGVGLVLDASPSGDGGTVFVSGATVPQMPDTSSMMSMFLPRLRAWDATPAPNFAQAVVATEHYNRLVRLIQAGEKPAMSVKLAVKFNGDDLNAYNTVAEIPGTDKKSELVMLGGHLDSWHGGTGATDNAAGVAVAMEAVRILKALNLAPRRTIRVALWTGEEQGLFGSKAYVAEHFGAPAVAQTPEQQMATMLGTAGGAARLRTKPEYDKLSAYFNLDNGAGKIRGVYLQGNEAVRPIFRQWLAPFKDLGATTLTAANTGSTDHVSFDALGLPGFQFIQDNLEYGTRTHHSTQDLYDRVPAEDMQQAATVMAAFIYQTAMRDELLPRKPAPGTEKAPAAKRKKTVAAR